MVEIDLGCGRHKVEGTFGLDWAAVPGVDLCVDLARGIPLADSSVDTVYAFHVLEHVDAPLRVVSEIHRVLKPTGRFVAEVPHHSNPYAHSDPTHRTLWGTYSFAYFVRIDDQPFRRKVPDTYVDEHFRFVEQQLVPMTRSRVSILRVLDRLWNRSPRFMEFWERYISPYHPMYAVRVTLTPRQDARLP